MCQAPAVYISISHATNILTQPTDILYGVCNTQIGQDSQIVTTIGTNKCQYLFNKGVKNIIDNDLTTKYVNFGQGNTSDIVGVGTGFIVVLSRGPAILQVSVEGSTVTDLKRLKHRKNWILIYTGPNGCHHRGENLARHSYCPVQFIHSNRSYTSYRVIIQSQRSAANNVQYSEAHLLGYFVVIRNELYLAVSILDAQICVIAIVRTQIESKEILNEEEQNMCSGQ
ncbi:unnamed protein product, partial [Didymodactylos carnosus]